MASSENDRTSFTDHDASPSEAVIEAVASATGEDPMEMEPLASVIDPDALDALVGGDDRGATEVSFRFQGCRVLVRGDGAIVAAERDS